MLRTNDISSKQLALAARGFRLLALNGDREARASAVALEAQLRHRFAGTDFNEAAVAATAALTRSSAESRPSTDTDADGTNRTLNEILRSMRKLLEMDIAFVTAFEGDQVVVRHVENSTESADILEVGQSSAFEQTYCKRVVDGRFPNAIPDTSKLQEAHELPATAAVKIGAYISVPVVLRNGDVYGTLCCISHTPRSALGNRQIDALRKVAEMVSVELERQRD
ncbi:MAG: diguanylate phosphodiesterase [Variovorax sp.]|jgi:transcriptional regulator with GAF, ATPase, and Fis domain|nr:diguanylate phosphodiesterase [Variovorax sp.]